VTEGGTEAVQGREDGLEMAEEGRAPRQELGNLGAEICADLRVLEKAEGE